MHSKENKRLEMCVEMGFYVPKEKQFKVKTEVSCLQFRVTPSHLATLPLDFEALVSQIIRLIMARYEALGSINNYISVRLNYVFDFVINMYSRCHIYLSRSGGMNS